MYNCTKLACMTHRQWQIFPLDVGVFGSIVSTSHEQSGLNGKFCFVDGYDLFEYLLQPPSNITLKLTVCNPIDSCPITVVKRGQMLHLNWILFLYRSSVKRKGGGVSYVGAATSIIFVVTKVLSWRLLSWQKYAGCDKTFVVTKMFCCDKHIFVVTKDVFCCDKHKRCDLSRQTQKISFVATNTKDVFCRDKHKRCVLSWQTQKMCFVATNTKDVFCRDKHVFFLTKILSWQKLNLWQRPPLIYIYIYLKLYTWMTASL